MTERISEAEADVMAHRLKEEAQAEAELASGVSPVLRWVAYAGAYGAAFIIWPFAGAFGEKFLIAFMFSGAVLAAIELKSLRRRLDAAVTLLKLRDALRR